MQSLCGASQHWGIKICLWIGDAGMPIPEGVEVIDLAVCGGVPRFEQVLDAVLAETEVEYYYLADEIQEKNEKLYQHIVNGLPGVEYEMMPHTDLKAESAKCRFAVRTGEFFSICQCDSSGRGCSLKTEWRSVYESIKFRFPEY
ncbi:MAG: RbsD/FucU domain-containing protein [Lachnospiraceae bacterium]